jgi:hypothetical protein
VDRERGCVAAFAVVASIGLCLRAPTQCDERRYRDLAHTDTVFTPRMPADADDWRTRSALLRAQVGWAAGLLPEPERPPITATVHRRIEHGDVVVEAVSFESSPGLFVTGNLYRPANVTGRVPAVLCPHGHWRNGRLHHDELGSVPARCITLARLGAVVFAYDMLGFQDSSRQCKHGDARLDTRANALWGIGTFQLQTWNSIRVLDWLASRDDVDADRIGVTGASGGGTQTFILSAIDPRVRVAAPVNMVSTIMQGGCVCENAPGLRIGTDNAEIAALFAPKPLLLVSATGDWTRNNPTVEFPYVRTIYALLGAEDRVENAHFDAPHNYDRRSRAAMYRFFVRELFGRSDESPIEEGTIEVPPRQHMIAFADGEAPDGVLDADALVARLRADAETRIGTLAPIDTQRLSRLGEIVATSIEHAIGARFPRAGEVGTTSDGERVGRAGRTLPWRVVAADSDGDGHTTLCIDDSGLDVRNVWPELVETLGRSGRVVAVEPFGTGTNVVPAGTTPARGSTRYFATFHRTDDAETVYDLVTALGALLLDPRVASLDVVATGRTAPALLAARALVPAELARQKSLRTVVDLGGFADGDDADYLARLELVGIRRAGGLRALAAEAATGPLWLGGAAGLEVGWARSAAELRHVGLTIEPGPLDSKRIGGWLGPR